MQLTTSAGRMAFRFMIWPMSHSIAPVMASASFRSTVVAPRRAWSLAIGLAACQIALAASGCRRSSPRCAAPSPAGRSRRCTARAELGDLLGRQPPRRPRLQGPEAQRPEGDPAQLDDRVADGLGHPPDLGLAALGDDELDLAVVEALRAGRPRAAVVELDALAQALEVVLA